MLRHTPPHLTVVSKPATHGGDIQFSVCTLVASWEKYERVLSSFTDKGFGPERAEFFAYDNTERNVIDAYGLFRDAYNRCRGRFLLFVHDDIELLEDDADALWRLLTELEARDPKWMVAGNSGVLIDPKHPQVIRRHLSDPIGEARMGGGPLRVKSLDENFLATPKARMVFPSLDLSGFHHYGVDLCIQAKLAGGSCYVIPFFLKHHSAGNNESEGFARSRRAVEDKYAPLVKSTVIRTPSSWLYIGGRARRREVYHEIGRWFLAKWQRLRYRLKKLQGK